MVESWRRRARRCITIVTSTRCYGWHQDCMPPQYVHMILHPYLHVTLHQVYLSAGPHAMSSQPHSACFKGLPPLMKDSISRLNHAAEAFEVARYQPYGASSLAALVHSIFAVRRYFICPAALRPCLIASAGPISSISKDPLYAQGSDASICSRDSCRASSSIASCLL
jgi:hypothetical protein